MINSNVLLKIVTELFTFSSFCSLYIAFLYCIMWLPIWRIKLYIKLLNDKRHDITGKCSAVVEMGDRLTTTDVGRKVAGRCRAHFRGWEQGAHLTQYRVGRGLSQVWLAIVVINFICDICCIFRDTGSEELFSSWNDCQRSLMWHSGRTSVFRRRTFAVLRSTCSWWVTTYVGKPSAIGQPTRPTQPFIPSGSINE